MMKIFLICPVRNADPDLNVKLANHVKSLEDKGHQVHWPTRDTEQDDPTGGYQICRTNFQAISDADEIHIWYDETSQGSMFDMGGAFMRVEMLHCEKKIVIVNKEEAEAADIKKKSFLKVMKYIAD